jgi:prepilin-type N-terminal cleavage/methylation domain-containing protein/uncharacterized repeat protein (TIGR02543 family)
MNKRKGFTLVELVVAIAILGVITLFALPSIRSIQGNNKDSKYVAYEKSIISAGKLYVDSYSEDLFGPHKTGCAIIKYSDLEERDYVSKIQLKNTDCGSNDTYIMVRKSESGNFHYDPNVVCKENGKIVYGVVAPANFEDMCKLGVTDPTIELYDVSKYKNQPAYKKGQKPDFKVKIADAGIGLLENQKLDYQWLVGTNAVSSGTINFNNKIYSPYSIKAIPNPPNIGETVGTTVYTLKLTGTIRNGDGRDNNKGASKEVKTFIGRVLIKYHSNGGVMAKTHGAAFSLKNEYVYKDNKLFIQQIVEGGTLPSTGLANWNSAKNINLAKTGFIANPGKEWNTKANGTGTNYNHTDQYSQTDFCTINYSDCEITLYVNWVKPIRTLTYDSNGGSACNPSTKTATDGTKWGALCSPTKKLYKFTGWIDKDTKKAVTKDTKATKNVTVVAQWQKLQYKPQKPTITNPSGGKWTKYNISLGIKTKTAAKYIGKWYYTFDKKTFYEFKTNKSKSTEGKNSFTSQAFKKEASRTVYVRVCSIYASSYKDTDNCSKYASTPLKIDKHPPVYQYPSKAKDRTYNYWTMVWKDNLSGLSTVNTGNYSRLYYCYGACSYGCTSRCCTSSRSGYTHLAKYNPGKGYYMRAALIDDNLVNHNTQNDRLTMETFRACNGGDYTVYLEAYICDQANNCVWQNESFDF